MPRSSSLRPGQRSRSGHACLPDVLTRSPFSRATLPFARRVLTHEELALDPKADYQEEDGHEPVVDPVGQGFGEGELAQADRQLRLPLRGVALTLRRIGPYEGHHRDNDQEDTAGSLPLGELLEGTHDALYRPLLYHAHVWFLTSGPLA
jgi:hypothetical protein